MALLTEVADGDLADGPTPQWLLRPGVEERGGRWPIVEAIYEALTGLTLPDTMPSWEWRTIDAVLTHPDGTKRLVEIDE